MANFNPQPRLTFFLKKNFEIIEVKCYTGVFNPVRIEKNLSLTSLLTEFYCVRRIGKALIPPKNVRVALNFLSSCNRFAIEISRISSWIIVDK